MTKLTNAFVVELRPDCWLSDVEGDPGRTLVFDNAKLFKTEKAAARALEVARQIPGRTFPDGCVNRVAVLAGDN